MAAARPLYCLGPKVRGGMAEEFTAEQWEEQAGSIRIFVNTETPRTSLHIAFAAARVPQETS
jgi:hypothetical protein